VRAQRSWVAGLLALLSILNSPVSGALLALALAGIFLSVKALRRISASTLGVIVVSMLAVAIAFGNPGPQPFPLWLSAELIGFLILFLLARPPEPVRVIVWLSMLVSALLLVIPNGMGSNFGRMVWFCLPVAVVAMGGRRLSVVLLLAAPALIAGAEGTVSDLRGASQPTASAGYYEPLAAEFDRIARLHSYRVEVVAEHEHAAYDALLNHAMLARGWETQEDHALNAALLDRQLDPITYKVWLDNNAVGYVALPVIRDARYPEYVLVAGGLPYLKEIWHNTDWTLFEVSNPSPVVGAPGKLIAHSQSRLTIELPSASTIPIRVRWSRYLRADERNHAHQARVADDGYGWTSLTVAGPGTYYLHGSLTPIFG
jgi:hypothetical protein